jgi:class 3 adenylate cyclase
LGLHDTIWNEFLGDVEKDGAAFAEGEGRVVWPDIGDDPVFFRRYAQLMRRSVSPGDAVMLFRIDSETDVRAILPSVRTPTLVMQRTGDQALPIEHARYVAQKIPGATLVELPGSNHPYVSPDQEAVLEQIERFVHDLRAEEAELDRVLQTVLFTDIARSTERAAEVGDNVWGPLLEQHHAIVRGMLARYGGVEVDTAGDGFFATFDGPARAVKCAMLIMEAVRPLGLEVRAGVHTGEVETIDGKVGGIAVAIGARICALAKPSEILASSTVKELVAGSGSSSTTAACTTSRVSQTAGISTAR